MMRLPQRTCIGCRRVGPRATLLRLVRRGDGLVYVDQTATAPGRGAYVCPLRECVESALKRGRLARAFRTPVEASTELAGLFLRGMGTRPGSSRDRTALG